MSDRFYGGLNKWLRESVKFTEMIMSIEISKQLTFWSMSLWTLLFVISVSSKKLKKDKQSTLMVVQ